MNIPKTREEVNTECEENGDIILLEYIPKARIKTILRLTAQDEIVFVHLKDSSNYTLRYRLIYDIIHELAQALLLCEGIKSRNHYCLFAQLCIKHSQFEWDFFEMMRKKRNGIAYYGEEITSKDLSGVYTQANIYIRNLRTEIENRL